MEWLFHKVNLGVHPTSSTNSSKKSSWWNDCSSTRDRKHPGQVSILYQRQAAWSPNFPQRWRSVPHVPLHLYGRQMRILPIGRKNLNPRPKAAEFFLMFNCLSRIFGTAKWRLAHNSDQEPMLPKSHTPQDNVIVWQICLFISLKIVKTQRLMRSVSNGRNRVKFTQSVRQKQWSGGTLPGTPSSVWMPDSVSGTPGMCGTPPAMLPKTGAGGGPFVEGKEACKKTNWYGSVSLDFLFLVYAFMGALQ